jgi:hypothetical protein
MRGGRFQLLKHLIVLLLAAEALHAQDAILKGTVVTPDKIISKMSVEDV